jgi:hypothetical protein
MNPRINDTGLPSPISVNIFSAQVRTEDVHRLAVTFLKKHKFS